MDSLNLTPEKDFFEYTEFFSSLNNKNIDSGVYEDMKFLYKTLRMRNLGDKNDLYNVQDVILLCEIIENRFQKMQNKFGKYIECLCPKKSIESHNKSSN